MRYFAQNLKNNKTRHKMKLQSIFNIVARAILAPVTVALVAPVFEYSPSRRRLYIPRV